MHWFDVDKAGLAKLLARRGKEFIIHELVQNAWDEDTTRVDTSLARIPGSRMARLTVEDDNPNGFADLSHAFTLFAESEKKADTGKRGRFNLGEKLVLALCDEAEISFRLQRHASDDARRDRSVRGGDSPALTAVEYRNSLQRGEDRSANAAHDGGCHSAY
jgi:hypothetical protein